MTNSNREPKNFLVTKSDGDYYVRGLSSDGDKDTMLLTSLPDGDVATPSNGKLMHAALYDLFQCEDGLMSGDSFITPHGLFLCEGVHVLPVAESKEGAKARRARLRRLARKS
jgi:hypothetical protein